MNLINFSFKKMDFKTKNLFFLGKGGVGKSTTSALTALFLSNNGSKTLLASMDPAHNQSDIFGMKFNEKPIKVKANLWVKEVDLNYWVKKYLNEVHFQIKKAYSYLTAFNLESYFDVIKYSPGIEEYALLLAFKEIREKFKDIDFIVFDMPPTALTLKFLRLPGLSLLWLNKLLELRNLIIEKRKIITKVKIGSKEIERDEIKNRLSVQIQQYENVKKIFENPEKTILNVVMNPDKLSFSESELIFKNLNEMGLKATNLIINKVPEGFDEEKIKENFNFKNLQLFPQYSEPLLGLNSLQNYLELIENISIF